MTSRTPAQIGKANRRAGIELEQAARKVLEAAGWFVMTTKHGGANKEPVDLMAAKVNYFGRVVLLAVQCKTNGYVAPAERASLDALPSFLDPVVAYWHKDGRSARVVRFRDLEGNEVKP